MKSLSIEADFPGICGSLLDSVGTLILVWMGMSFRRANSFPTPKGTNGTCESSLGGALSSKAVLGLCSTGLLMKYLRQLIYAFKKSLFLFPVLGVSHEPVAWKPWWGSTTWRGACGRVRLLPGRQRRTHSPPPGPGPLTRPHPSCWF